MFIFDFEDTISFSYVDDNTTKAKLFKDSWAKGITNLAAAAGLSFGLIQKKQKIKTKAMLQRSGHTPGPLPLSVFPALFPSPQGLSAEAPAHANAFKCIVLK